MTRSLLLTSLLTLLPASLASAVVTVYTDRAAFESAIGPHVIYTFELDQGFPAAPAEISSVGPISTNTFSAANPAALRPHPEDSGNQTLSGAWSAVTTGPLRLTFQQPQFAVGLDMYTHGITGLISVHYADGSDMSYGLGRQADLLAPSFLGLLSDQAIDVLVVENDGDHRSQQYRGIDNLIILPEPASLAALLGAVVLSVASRGIIRGVT